tara:strand:+ start:748 stop:1341 length:594 start_codon:yes stop_codon:yes gene_type:complete
MNTLSAFSIPIGIAEVPMEICDKLKPYKGMDQIIQKDPNYSILNQEPSIKTQLTDIFSDWVNSLLGFNHKWVMTTSWITDNSDGKEMDLHNHKNCMYSSVLYFDKCSEDHSPLAFINPITSQLSQGWYLENSANNVFTANNMVAPYKEGLMLFFPSYLLHGHRSFNSSVVRRSLACNFFAIGEYGAGDSTMNTKWLT